MLLQHEICQGDIRTSAGPTYAYMRGGGMVGGMGWDGGGTVTLEESGILTSEVSY